MTKEEIKGALGHYVQLIFTLYSKKHKVETYFELYGHIIRVENKYIELKDNHNHSFIVEIVRIKEVKIEKSRRKLKPKKKDEVRPRYQRL
jgi:hypothetical protein